LFVMKHHISLQAVSSIQAHSKHLRVYMYRLSYRNVVSNLTQKGLQPYEAVATKKISAFNGCESGGTVPMKP
jgi:hypothetical protein